MHLFLKKMHLLSLKAPTYWSYTKQFVFLYKNIIKIINSDTIIVNCKLRKKASECTSVFAVNMGYVGYVGYD